VEKGVEIIRGLTGNISGYAMPRFVIDAPNGGGKIPVNPEYIISKDETEVVLHNYKGDTCVYPQPADI
jgi:lysine 2,3-aminomutase